MGVFNKGKFVCIYLGVCFFFKKMAVVIRLARLKLNHACFPIPNLKGPETVPLFVDFTPMADIFIWD